MAVESRTGKKKASNTLAPGFRFHPTDEELVRYYLRRKVCGKAFVFDAISEIDIYKAEPWDLPCMSKLKTRDLEWYFFSILDKKYGNGARTNRATEKGYWKTTGKDRAVYHKNEVVGMKKTLVYHCGRAPKGQRSNWVMHEYRLVDLELERAGIPQEAFVLCRVFQKSGSGPKNGEQYGAPFVEEEWDDDELDSVSEDEATEKVNFGDNTCLNSHDLQQITGSDVPPHSAPLLLTFPSADGSYVEEPTEVSSKTLDITPVKQECVGECSNSDNSDYMNYLLNEPFLDSFDNLEYDGDGGFIEANDLSNPVETNTSAAVDMLDEYLTFFDAKDDSSLFFTYEPPSMTSEAAISDQSLKQPLIEANDLSNPHKELGKGTELGNLPNEQTIDNKNNNAASSSGKQDSAKYQSDLQYPFITKASKMLGNIPAPSAFAAEFPSKEAVHQLNSLSQSSSSVTGMIQIRNLNTVSNQRSRSPAKNENLNIILSFGFSQSDDGSSSLVSSFSIRPGKTASTISSSWFFYLLFWVLILSISFKIGTFICAK